MVLLPRGKVATIDLGRFVPAREPPRHFVHAATVGLNASFVRIATRGDIRDRLGRFAYVLAAAYAMRRRAAFGCELSYAGTTEKVTLTQLSVTNASVFGGPLQLSVPDSNPDDRLLDMLAIEELEVTLDGEICGTLPGEFEIAGNALRIITPLDFDD